MPNPASSRFHYPARVIMLAAFVCCAVSAAAAQTLHGRVIEVHAGDALTLLDTAGARYEISLAAIAAPRQGQPYAAASREHLARWVDQRVVIVEVRVKDRGGTLRGTVFVDGHDINLEQVRAGLCRQDPRSAFHPSGDMHEVYMQAERAARARKLGLWAGTDASPASPWPDHPPH